MRYLLLKDAFKLIKQEKDYLILADDDNDDGDCLHGDDDDSSDIKDERIIDAGIGRLSRKRKLKSMERPRQDFQVGLIN